MGAVSLSADVAAVIATLFPAAKPAAPSKAKKPSTGAIAAKKTDAPTADTPAAVPADATVADAPLTSAAKTSDGPVTRRKGKEAARE